MKKKFHLLSSLFLIVCALSSCESVEEPVLISDSKLAVNDSSIEMQADSGIFSFRYKGNDYSYPYQVINDEIHYLDQSIENIANQLKDNPSVAAYIHEDGLIEYFDNEKELEKNVTTTVNTRATIPMVTSGQLIVFEDSKCKGKTQTFAINGTKQHVDIANLGDDWNDIISSLDLTCTFRTFDVMPNPCPTACVAIFYEHENFGGYSISFSVGVGETHSYIHYLKSYPLYPGSNKNWNDKITSLRFTMNKVVE
jgi:hypothetical protein